MFGRPGNAYVYFIYGNHHCMNVVAHPTDVAGAGAVLLRGAEPLVGFDGEPRALAGPGRLGRAFGLTTADSGADLVRGPLHLRAGAPVPDRDVVRTSRIGIAESSTSEKPWRFLVRGAAGVSR